jgi:hypothetical protein
MTLAQVMRAAVPQLPGKPLTPVGVAMIGVLEAGFTLLWHAHTR